MFTAEDAAEHLAQLGRQRVFIARGIYGNPWVFGDARALALDGIPVPARSSVERLDALREHLTLTHELPAAHVACPCVRKLVLKGMPHAAAAMPMWCAAPRMRSLWRWSMRSSMMWWPARAALAAGESVPLIRWRLKVAVTAVRARAVLRSKCRYCDFDSRSFASCKLGAALDAYFEQLFARLDAFGKAGALDQIRTVYVGGGTPSLAGAPGRTRPAYLCVVRPR